MLFTQSRHSIGRRPISYEERQQKFSDRFRVETVVFKIFRDNQTFSEMTGDFHRCLEQFSDIFSSVNNLIPSQSLPTLRHDAVSYLHKVSEMSSKTSL